MYRKVYPETRDILLAKYKPHHSLLNFYSIYFVLISTKHFCKTKTAKICLKEIF